MRKRRTIRVITFLSAGLVAVSVLAYTGMRRAHSLELYARANTQHAFDELVTNVSELSNALDKCLYATDPALESALCTQMFGRAATAQMAMGILPYSSAELEQTAGFLSRVGDYACTLARTVGDNGGYSEEELENLTALAETANVMTLNLQDMQARMSAGDMTMDEVVRASSFLEAEGTEAPLAGTAFRSMEAEFPELPTLIYDGPFSESMTSPTPVFLEGLPEVDEASARRSAAAFLNVREDDVVPQGECGGTIPCRRFSAYLSGAEYSIMVTKQGGLVLSSLCSRLPGEPKFSVREALSAAEDFIGGLGIPDLTESYHMIEGGVLTVNYEYEQDGVICYPDLIKVGVALDNGSIMSYDAKGYLSEHHERKLPEIAVSADEARLTVPPTLTVEAERLSLIPSEGGEERLCHEFTCTAQDDRHYLVYVNAVTGAQERILILLEDESGTLTI